MEWTDIEKTEAKVVSARAEKLYERYRDYIDRVVPIFSERNVRSFSRFDAFALGVCLEGFEDWLKTADETLVREHLGYVLPKLLDLIALSYAKSILPSLVSVQPIFDDIGVVFYKKLRIQDKKFLWETVSDTINSMILLLDGCYGFLVEGKNPELAEEDLIQEVNAVVANLVVKQLVKACPSTVEWSIFQDEDDSVLTFIDAIEQASTKISDSAGRGVVTFMIVSGNPKADPFCGASIVSSQPVFKKTMTNSVMGPQHYGILNDNILVIKAPESLVPTDEIYCGYRGMNWFEAFAVYSPRHYLMITQTVAISEKLTWRIGIGHKAGFETVVPEFLTKIKIITK
jgi:hypothetical protein